MGGQSGGWAEKDQEEEEADGEARGDCGTARPRKGLAARPGDKPVRAARAGPAGARPPKPGPTLGSPRGEAGERA